MKKEEVHRREKDPIFLTYYRYYPYEAVVLLADQYRCGDVMITDRLWPYEPQVGRTLFTGPCDVERWLRSCCIRDAAGSYILHAYSMAEYINRFLFQFEPEIRPYIFRFLDFPDLDWSLGGELLKAEVNAEEKCAQEQYLAAPDALKETLGSCAGAIGYWQLLQDAPILHRKKEETPPGVWSRWYRG